MSATEIELILRAVACRMGTYPAEGDPALNEARGRGGVADLCSSGVDTGFVDLGYAKLAAKSINDRALHVEAPTLTSVRT
jgi:hypothetical protein